MEARASCLDTCLTSKKHAQDGRGVKQPPGRARECLFPHGGAYPRPLRFSEVSGMRRITFWIVGTFFTTLSPAAFATPADGQIMVSVYDFAHIGPKTVAQSEQLATRIFALAGVDAQWNTGSLSDAKNAMLDFSPTGPEGCTAPLPAVLRVQVLSRAPNGLPSQALGFSLPCAERGMQVTLFEDRIETVGQTYHASFYRVLAYALAHELGHVLLRSELHEKSGLMKAIWTANDWQCAAVTIIPFSPDDIRLIAGQLSAVKTHAAELAEAITSCHSGGDDSHPDRPCPQ